MDRRYSLTLKTAYLFIFDGFADWEPASAIAELRRTFGFAVKTAGLSFEPITSMGGLRVIPDITLGDLEPLSSAILILPGGDSWTKGEQPEVSQAARAMMAADRPVAAICAATLALAWAGLLDGRLHTSNGKGFVASFVPSYRGKDFYRVARAVSDQGIITANGLAPFAFAAEIFRSVAPERLQDISTYESLYARGLLD